LSSPGGDDYYVPVRQAGDTGSPIHLLAVVNDDATVHALDALNNSENKPTTLWGMQHPNDLGKPPDFSTDPVDIDGMVHSIDPSTKSGARILDDFNTDSLLVIHKDEHPSALLGFGTVIAGIVMCLGSLASFGVFATLAGFREMRTVQASAAARATTGYYGQQTEYAGPAPPVPPTYAPAPGTPPYTAPYAPPQQPYGQGAYGAQPAPAAYPQQQPYPQPQVYPAAPVYPTQPANYPDQPPYGAAASQIGYAPAPAPPAATQPPAPEPTVASQTPAQAVDADTARLQSMKAFDPFADDAPAG